MRPLLVAIAGTGLGLGLWVSASALRGVPLIRGAARRSGQGHGDSRTTWRFVGAVALGVVAWSLTGWLVLGVGVVGMAWVAPSVFAGAATRRADAEVAEGIASWTAMIRDTMAGAAGLETAIATTAAIAPASIRPQLAGFTARLRHSSLAASLPFLRTDLNHPSADLLVAALGAAARFDARDIGGLLEEAVKSIRADAEMRARVEVGRARIRTSARLVTGANLVLFVLLVTGASQLLSVYDTAHGQVFLAVVVGVWLCALWMLARLSRFDLPERFRLRAETEVQEE